MRGCGGGTEVSGFVAAAPGPPSSPPAPPRPLGRHNPHPAKGGIPTEHLTKAEKIRQFGEVFTPLPTVNEMLDTLEAADPAIFDPNRTFLEPACGDGAFVVEILRRKFERCRRPSDYRTALESVYGLELQADNVRACIRNVTELCYHYFRPTKSDLNLINDHIIQCDSLKIMKLLATCSGGYQPPPSPHNATPGGAPCPTS